MSETIDLAAALPRFCDRRNPQGQSNMTQTPAPAKAPKTKRRDAYVATIKVQIPLTDSASLIEAMKAVEEIARADAWPDGSTVSHDGGVKRV